MSEYEYYEAFPEIRKDITYVFECDDYETWRGWHELYKGLPNVQVIMKMKGTETSDNKI